MSQSTGGQSPQSRVRAIPFGKYLLLDRIAVGGMAEVFLAKSFGIEGFEKIIAVKRILPTMAEDEDFIEMFIDEAKIAGHLNHANIVPIYELGKIGESHYIAMEYVWGKDLLQMMNRFRKMRKRMPAPMVAFIAARMCEALEYAHGKRDRSGQPLNLIHRDISPQNVLVSYEGAVKLIDFGIAKAASRTTTTQAGVLKGKFGYMSPEQVRGLPIDSRSDLFAVGTCMYEMLTADRLFVGESDFSTLEKVRHASVRPPSEVIQDLPPEFEQIVMRALARNVDDRWQSAGELHEALQQFMVMQRPTFTTTKLAAWMNSAFADEVAKEKGRLDGYAQVARPAPVAAEPKMTARPPSRPASEPPMDAMDAFDELEGESTMITASPFDAMEAAHAAKVAAPPAAPPPAEDIEGEATQIFFSMDELEVIPDDLPSAGPLRVHAPSGFPAPPPPRRPGPPPPRAAPSPFPSASIALGTGDLAAQSGSRPTMPGSMDTHGPIGQGPSSGGYGQLGPAPGAHPPLGQAPVGPTGGFELPPGGTPALATQEIARPAAESSGAGKKVMIAVLAVLALATVIGGALFAFGGADVGTIEIRTVPNVSAEVRIDGVARGVAPVRIDGIPAGERSVSLVAPGYQTWQQNVAVAEGGISTLSVALIAQGPAIAANVPPTMDPAQVAQAQAPPETEPEPEVEAEVEPEPEVEPETTRTSDPASTMRVTMRVTTMADESPAIMRIVRTQTMDDEPSMSSGGRGTLVINTIPWAEVYVDGRATGQNTPVRGLRISAGHHRIGLKTQDGTMHNVEVDVPAGDTVRIMRRLE